MILLIDYDNVPEAERRLGVTHVVRKAFEFCNDQQSAFSRVRARLYGGWYEGGVFTRTAQKLFSMIRTDSPIRISSPQLTAPLLIDVELAVSALSQPSVQITNTFRVRGLPGNIRCESRPWISCLDEKDCPLSATQEFFSSGVCANSGCSVVPGEILSRAEQKVVDTMMVADLIFSAHQGTKHLGVVSRDDDIWPGLSIAAAFAQDLVHLSTAKASRMPSYFAKLHSPPYRRISWS